MLSDTGMALGGAVWEVAPPGLHGSVGPSAPESSVMSVLTLCISGQHCTLDEESLGTQRLRVSGREELKDMVSPQDRGCQL